jgi:hypothetical protein
LDLQRQVAARQPADLATESGLTAANQALPGRAVARVLSQATKEAASPDDEWLPGREKQHAESTMWCHNRYHLNLGQLNLGLRHAELLAGERLLSK